MLVLITAILTAFKWDNWYLNSCLKGVFLKTISERGPVCLACSVWQFLMKEGPPWLESEAHLPPPVQRQLALHSQSVMTLYSHWFSSDNEIIRSNERTFLCCYCLSQLSPIKYSKVNTRVLVKENFPSQKNYSLGPLGTTAVFLNLYCVYILW